MKDSVAIRADYITLLDFFPYTVNSNRIPKAAYRKKFFFTRPVMKIEDSGVGYTAHLTTPRFLIVIHPVGIALNERLLRGSIAIAAFSAAIDFFWSSLCNAKVSLWERFMTVFAYYSNHKLDFTIFGIII